MTIFPSCISYLLLCSKLVQNLVNYDNRHLLSPTVSGVRNLGWLRWEVVGLWWGFNEGVCWDSSNRKAWLGGRIHFQACAWQLARGLLSCLAVLWRPQFLNCGLPQDCSWYGGWLPPELMIGKREKQLPRQKLQYFS